MGVRPRGGAEEPREIHVEIDELALDGFPGDPARVLAAFEAELARLVREYGVPLAADGRAHHADTVGGLPPLPRTVSAGRLGEALARSVHAGLGGRGTSVPQVSNGPTGHGGSASGGGAGHGERGRR